MTNGEQSSTHVTSALHAGHWVVRSKHRPEASTKLFCFPHAGVGISAYRGWSEAASQNFEICTIQLPGRENRLRERPLDSLALIVRQVADAIGKLDDRPFAFFGHSLGAIVAFETAREIRRRGGALPLVLFVSASRAPQLPWPHPPVRHLADLELLTEVNRRYDSVPEVILADEELRQLLTPALRADMALVETYCYEAEPPFEFPIVAFGGDSDPMVRRADVEQWRAQTSGVFRLRMMPAAHLFLEAKRSELLHEVKSTLGASGASSVTPLAE